MSQLIGRPETILSLFQGEALDKLNGAILRAVHRSCLDAQGKMFNLTRAEVKERVEACFKQAKILRGDLKWGVERIIGQLDEVLRCHLAKMDYTPPERQCWIPEDGQ
jgi:hypothetical protein